MANINSTNIANISNGDKNDNRGDGGRERTRSGSAVVTSGEGSGSTYRLFRVRSGDTIKSVQAMSTGTLGASFATTDIGLYSVDGGAVVDIDILAANTDFSGANDPWLEFINTGVGYTSLTSNSKVFERLGLSSDPFLEYDVVVTSNGDPGASGSLAVRIEYVDGS